MKYLLLLLSTLSTSLVAQCHAENSGCVVIEQWQWSMSIGAGVISNPLHGGKNIPLVLIPNVSYYGEKFFIENSLVGYSFYENKQLSVSLISQLNGEKAFFSRWHPSNLFIGEMTHALVDDKHQQTELNDNANLIGFDELPERKWAIDGGLQLNWFFAKNSDVKAQLLHDLNHVYNGFNAQVEINHFVHFKQLEQAIIRITLGGNWQSRQQVAYYYGVDEQYHLSTSAPDLAKASFSPFIKLFGSYPLTKEWSVRVNLGREFLSRSLTDSPIVADNVIDTFFVGVTYAF